MKISFVIPAHNEEAYIEKCISSILKELGGATCGGEIIVVDNASTDKTAKKAAAFPGVRVVQEPEKGLCYARQAGQDASTGELVAHIDADNRLPRGWLSFVLRSFEQNPDLVGLSGPIIYYDLPSYARAITQFYYYAGYLFYRIGRLFGKGTLFQGGNAIMRREAMKQIGGFNLDIDFYGEDTDTGRRLASAGTVLWTFRLPIYSSGRRIAAEGLFHMGLKYGINYIWILLFHHPFTRDAHVVR